MVSIALKFNTAAVFFAQTKVIEMQDNKTQIIYFFIFAATEAFLIISSNTVNY